jgi:hypothetical protein
MSLKDRWQGVATKGRSFKEELSNEVVLQEIESKSTKNLQNN